MTIPRTILASGLCLMLCGCGTKHGDRPAVHPVSGKLLVAGKPAANAEVVLYPVAGAGEAGPVQVRPHATVEADGSYHLTTFVTRDGAPVGDFAVTVIWPGPRVKGQGDDEPGPDRLLQRYGDPKKPAASVHIGTETTELATIDLKPVEEKPNKAAGADDRGIVKQIGSSLLPGVSFVSTDQPAGRIPVRVEGVTKRFRQGESVVEAIKDVSLRIEEGEFVAVMGASGSGKSTLLHVMAGLAPPDEGRVVIDGADLSTMSDGQLTRFRRRKIGLVFQAFNLIPSLTADDNITLPILADGRNDRIDERVEHLLDRLGLVSRRRHRPDALSGGEQQRVAIARGVGQRSGLGPGRRTDRQSRFGQRAEDLPVAARIVRRTASDDRGRNPRTGRGRLGTARGGDERRPYPHAVRHRRIQGRPNAGSPLPGCRECRSQP